MIEDHNLEERHVIPRWLTIQRAIESGMLARPGVTKQSALTNKFRNENLSSMSASIARAQQAWGINRSRESAEELLEASLVSGSVDETVIDAAEFVHKDPRTALWRDLSGSILKAGSQARIMPVAASETIQRELQRRKILLRLNPRDALLLTETALLYANLGQLGKSEDYLKRALLIAPNSRYVVRSSARFFCHLGQPDQALWTIQKSVRRHVDPWLKSAELAVSSLAGKTSSDWRKSKLLSEDTSLSLLDRSELASQIATLEAFGGSRKAAQRSLNIAVSDPTENAIAQVEFIERKSGIAPSGASRVDVSRSMEALAFQSYDKEAAKEALDACGYWQEIEPFSSRPAVFASFVSTAFNAELESALSISNNALRSNAHNGALLNNISVLYAYSGDVRSAEEFSKKSKMFPDENNEVTSLATDGLIAFRSGNLELGVSNYMQAIQLASKARRLDLFLRAYAFFARETCRIYPNMRFTFDQEFSRVEKLVEKTGKRFPKDISIIRKEFIGAKPWDGEANADFRFPDNLIWWN